jgi:Zn-dependent peptidase ImmA (M78 family)/transcriptional regulator with XRE-family HTH domain
MVATQPDFQAPVIPRRVRAARELRGLAQREVVEQMDQPISAGALSQIESGKTRPSASTLAQLAQVLDVPVGFFTSQWPTTGSQDDEPVTFFRDLRSTPVRDRKRAAASALLLSDLLIAIQTYVRFPDVDLPHHPIDRLASVDQIENAAARARRAWNLGDNPIPNVVRELERHGVPVARLRIGTHAIDSFTCEYGTRPIVLLTDDKTDNYVRSRFDAAHELGHLVMHDGAEPGTKMVEAQAQQFASAFLLPLQVAEADLPRRLDGSGWARLADLKRRWGISMAALLFRAKSLRLIGDETYRNAVILMSNRGWRTLEPGDREMGPPESPLLIERALTQVEAECQLSIDDLIEHAQLPAIDTKELVEASIDYRPRLEI